MFIYYAYKLKLFSLINAEHFVPIVDSGRYLYRCNVCMNKLTLQTSPMLQTLSASGANGSQLQPGGKGGWHTQSYKGVVSG